VDVVGVAVVGAGVEGAEMVVVGEAAGGDMFFFTFFEQRHEIIINRF